MAKDISHYILFSDHTFHWKGGPYLDLSVSASKGDAFLGSADFENHFLHISKELLPGLVM